MEEESKSLPTKDNFSEWYNELLMMAQVMDVRYPIKGVYVWYPFGFQIRKKGLQHAPGAHGRGSPGVLLPDAYPENGAPEGIGAHQGLRG